MSSPRPIRLLLKVKINAVHLLLILVLAAMAVVISGCASSADDENTSVRPWASPEGWEGGALGSMLNDQHR
jgi:heme A synthase